MAARKKAPSKDSETDGKGRLVSVFGEFNSRALVEVPTHVAQALIGQEIIDPAPAFVIDAVSREVADQAARAPALAASALTLAYELANPYNSATSKASCAKELREALDRLRELAPPKAETDRIDEVNKKREQRRSRRASA